MGSKVRHLTSVHAIGDNRIFYRECKGLADAGHDVALIVGHPPTGPVAGVPVIGVGSPRNRVDRATRVVWNVLRAARRERAEIYHLHDPELLWAGLLLKLLGHRVVYDVHEDAPEADHEQVLDPVVGQAGPLDRHGAARWSAAAAAVLDGIVAATPSIAERFPADKTVVVQNFPRLAAARVSADAPDFDQRPSRLRLHRWPRRRPGPAGDRRDGRAAPAGPGRRGRGRLLRRRRARAGGPRVRGVEPGSTSGVG